MKYFILFLLFSTSAFGAEVCKDIDVSSWTMDQKVMVQSVVASLSGATGNYVPPTGPNGKPLNEQITKNIVTVCFQDPAFNINTLVTEQNILNKYNADELLRDAAKQQNIADQLASETMKLEIADGERNWTSLTTAQKLDVLRKLIKHSLKQQQQ